LWRANTARTTAQIDALVVAVIRSMIPTLAVWMLSAPNYCCSSRDVPLPKQMADAQHIGGVIFVEGASQ
jgi:hypothetical protein